MGARPVLDGSTDQVWALERGRGAGKEPACELMFVGGIMPLDTWEEKVVLKVGARLGCGTAVVVVRMGGAVVWMGGTAGRVRWFVSGDVGETTLTSLILRIVLLLLAVRALLGLLPWWMFDAALGVPGGDTS